LPCFWGRTDRGILGQNAGRVGRWAQSFREQGAQQKQPIGSGGHINDKYSGGPQGIRSFSSVVGF